MSTANPSHVEPARPALWEAPTIPYPARDRLALLTLTLVPALLVALVLALLAGSWWLGAALAGLWLLKIFAEARWTDAIILRRVGAQPIDAAAEPRLANLVEGIAADLSVEAPRLYEIEEGGPNALVASGGGGGVLAVTRSLLDGFTRTELEAVVAHCLARLQSKNFVYSNLAARWSDLGAGIAPRVGAADDVRAASLTRYPPALAAAIRKADPAVMRYAPLWFVADAPSHERSEERAALVADL